MTFSAEALWLIAILADAGEKGWREDPPKGALAHAPNPLSLARDGEVLVLALHFNGGEPRYYLCVCPERLRIVLADVVVRPARRR